MPSETGPSELSEATVTKETARILTVTDAVWDIEPLVPVTMIV